MLSERPKPVVSTEGLTACAAIAEGGERKDREQLRERAAADRRAVHRDKDRRPRDVQQGADVKQQIPRAVAVAGAVEIEQDLGEGVGQNDKDQSNGRDAMRSTVEGAITRLVHSVQT